MESSGNWVVDNIVNALNTWNGKLAEISTKWFGSDISLIKAD